MGYKSLLISIAASLLIALTFIPLKNRIQSFADRFFYSGTQEEIARENELLRQEVAQTEHLKAVATIASGMAHEIRNPLTAIKTFSEYLPKKIDDKEFLQKFSRIVGGEVDRIDGIIHQLLEFARPSPLTLKEVDIHGLITNTLEFLSSRFIKTGIKVVTEFQSQDPLFIQADINQLRQALLNIFLNAIEAMPHGGTLTIRTTIHDSLFTIHISDTGPGISPNDLKHIFDPFYTKKDGGTGLGLSITQRIIKDHGGKIFAQSILGKGTTMGMELPLTRET